MANYTAAQFIKAIEDSGGIISTIARRVGCDWHTAKRYIEEYATVQQAYQDERNKVIDIAEAKRRAATGPMTLIGNIEQSDLRHRAPDEIEELVRYAVCKEGRDHFILGHSDVVISEIDNLTRENIVRYIEAGVKYGTFDVDEC